MTHLPRAELWVAFRVCAHNGMNSFSKYVTESSTEFMPLPDEVLDVNSVILVKFCQSVKGHLILTAVAIQNIS